MQTVEPTEKLRAAIHDDEQLQWVVRPSGTARLLGTGLGALIAGLLFGGSFGAGTGFVVWQALESQSLGITAGIGVFLFLLVLIAHRPLLRFLVGTTEYAATDKRIIKFDDFFGQSLSSVPHEGVQDAEYNISFVENIFDLGTVSLDTGRGYETLSFPYTADPAAFTQAVTDVAQQAHQRSETAPPESYTPGSELPATDPVAGLAENLYPDEELLWVVRPDKTTRLLAQLPGLLFGTLLGSAILGGILGGAAFVITESQPTALLVGALGAAYVIVAKTGSTVFSYLYGTTQYAATDRRVLKYEGTLGKHLTSLPLAGIQDAEYSVSALEKRLGIGTVTIDTDRGYNTASFSYVASPAAFTREITHLAASGIADREAVHPSEIAVGDGVEPESPTADLLDNIPDDQTRHWVVTPDHWASFLSRVVKAVTLNGSPFGPFGALQSWWLDTTEYALTDSQLVEYSGRAGRELSGVPLDGIQDADYDMDYIEARFGVGDVTVNTDKGYERFRLETVSNPVAIAREISEVANAHRVADRAPTEKTETEPPQDSPDAPSASAYKQCGECESEIDALATFCPDCGTPQPRPDGDRSTACPDCGGAIGDTDAFCRHCGTDTA